ncbi:MAG: hypothetical protein ACYC3I_16310 [Gemmataceae bacterium]
MSEPFAERLSRFTPDATSLDRDALLFAAGRASASSSWRWQTLAGVLAASQLLTLVCLWPRTPPSSMPAPAPFAASDSPSADAPSHELTHYPPRQWTLRTPLRSLDLDEPQPLSDEPMVPPEPPLRAFGSPPASILN